MLMVFLGIVVFFHLIIAFNAHFKKSGSVSANISFKKDFSSFVFAPKRCSRTKFGFFMTEPGSTLVIPDFPISLSRVGISLLLLQEEMSMHFLTGLYLAISMASIPPKDNPMRIGLGEVITAEIRRA